ncbi:PQQ-binding-like beta-propeller repeat protein [Haloferax sp. YSMS24]|uniref:outer membrane protein assembly factor BamB family protein n=1 Tax=Haloferax sp. YSMS24 TaxID=3388425 RepID=UPI00398D4BA8
MVPRRTFLAALSAVLAGCSTVTSPDTTTEQTQTSATATTTSPSPSPTTTTTTTEKPPETTATPEPTCDTRWTPTVQWSFSTNVRAYQPTVADGVVYVGEQGGAFHALDAASGEVLWSRPATLRFGTAPVVSNRTVTLVGDDSVVAYDTATGDERWTVTPPGARASVPPTHDSDGETVFFGASQRPTPQTDPDPVYDRVYAVDRQTGDEVWNVSIGGDDVDDYDDWAVPEAVVADAGRVFVSTEQSELVVLDAEDGSVLWRRRFSSTTSHAERPVVAGERVFQVLDGVGYVLDVETGTEEWQALGEYPPAIAGDTSYWVGHSSVVARDVADGAVRWRLQIPTEGCLRTPAVGDDVLYVPTGCGSTKANVHAIDATDGCWLGSFELESSNATTPVVSDDSVFVGGLNGAANVWSLSAAGADDSS